MRDRRHYPTNSTLLALSAGHRLRYLAAIAALAASVVLGLLVPLVTKQAIDDIAAGRATSASLARAAVAAGLLTAAAALFVYLRGRAAAAASEGIVRALRNRLFDHLGRLPSRYHDRSDTGDLVQRATSDVETVRQFLAVQVVEVGRAVLLLVVVVPLLLGLDRGMTLVSLALMPAVVAFALVFFRRIQAQYLAADEAEAAMTSRLQENLTGIRVVRAFARQEFEGGKFAERNRDYRDRSLTLIRLLGSYWAISDLLCVGQVGLVAMVGAARLRDGSIGAGTLFACLSYVYLLIHPVRHMGRLLSDMGKATVALGRIREVLAAEVERDPDGVVAPDESVRGRVELTDLSFSYRGEPSLDRVSFTIEPGQTLAILGPPGSGKSTIAHLLLRFYDYTHGSIRLDGRELRSLPLGFVRDQIGCVLQEPFLFSRTVGENLVLARPDASREAAIESAQVACIHDAIASFEHGYDTLVGERGVTLSGGQRQRVALARALLKDPPVLILDDALSAVDTATETRILSALEMRRGRRTTIVIAHRLTTLAHADAILVLERGRVVERGTHAELVAKGGAYGRLWEIQSSIEEELGSDRGPAARIRGDAMTEVRS